MAITDFLPGSGSSDGLEEMCGGFQLTRKQRLYGFGICMVTGFVVSVLSFLLLAISAAGFAVLYTFGNIISLIATGFLVGFLTQLKKMFDPIRLVATIIFIAAMVVTFLVAILLGNAILVLVCVLVQYCALFWYSASYIPFARDAMKKVFGGLMR